MLCYPLFARSHLLSPEQHAVAVDSNGWGGRPGGIYIYQLQSIVLAEEIVRWSPFFGQVVKLGSRFEGRSHAGQAEALFG
jgi:hypothetical protein